MSVANLNQLQLLALTIYDNYQQMITDGSSNTAELELSAFLSNETYTTALQGAAEATQRTDIQFELNQNGHNLFEPSIDAMVSDIETGNLSNVGSYMIQNPLISLDTPSFEILNTIESAYNLQDSYPYAIATPEFQALIQRAGNMGIINRQDWAQEIYDAEEYVESNPDVTLQASADNFIITNLAPSEIEIEALESIRVSEITTPAIEEVAPTTLEVLPVNASFDVQDVPSNTAAEITWNDKAIVSTYEEILALNSESVASASMLTQEAYSYVQPIVDLEIEQAQYNINPATYIQNGNLPPSEQDLIDAENAAYDYLAGLSPEDGVTLSQEVSQIVASDAEQGITPLAPQLEGGQQYLADAGINSNGTGFLATPEIETSPNINLPTGLDTAPLGGDVPNLSGLFVGAAYAETLPEIDTQPHEQPAIEVIAETPSLSFGDVGNTTNGGIDNAFPATELSWGTALDGVQITTDFDARMNLSGVAVGNFAANSGLVPVSTPLTPVDMGTYEVQSGDTLWEIVDDAYPELNDSQIAQAVMHVAHANPDMLHPNGESYNLSSGANAGAIFSGQEINLPPEDVVEMEMSPDQVQEFWSRQTSVFPGQIEYNQPQPQQAVGQTLG